MFFVIIFTYLRSILAWSTQQASFMHLIHGTSLWTCIITLGKWKWCRRTLLLKTIWLYWFLNFACIHTTTMKKITRKLIDIALFHQVDFFQLGNIAQKISSFCHCFKNKWSSAETICFSDQNSECQRTP